MRNLLSIHRLMQTAVRSGACISSKLCVEAPVYVSVRTHLGYIPASGRIGRFLAFEEKTLLEFRKLNVQPIKKATFTFDPMLENYHSIRNVMYFFNKPKVLEGNVKIIVKTDIVDDRRDPSISLDLNDGRTLEIKTGNLDELEIIRVINYYLMPLITEEKAATETKSAAKGAAGGGKKAAAGKKK